MGWTYRAPEHHKHDMPHNISHDHKNPTCVGDQWTCKCGDVFEVSAIKVVYDQRDGDFENITWKPATARYAPSTPDFWR